MSVRGHVQSKPKFPSYEDCPDRDQHTPAPHGYLGWHEWAETMTKTHVQRRCETCGFLTQWVPRDGRTG